MKDFFNEQLFLCLTQNDDPLSELSKICYFIRKSIELKVSHEKFMNIKYEKYKNFLL